MRGDVYPVVMTDSIILYTWRVKDTVSPYRNKKKPWRIVGWKMPEAEARAWAKSQGYSEIERVDGPEERQYDLGFTGDVRRT